MYVVDHEQRPTAKSIGILTAGGDSPGLDAAIRGVSKTAIGAHDMHVIGFRDGFRGLMENRSVPLGPGAAPIFCDLL